MSMDTIVFIPLTQGKVAVVDFADFELVRPFKWSTARHQRRHYASRSAGRTSRLMHNHITGVKQVDHRNGNGLDNRRCNLRLFNQSQNMKSFRRKPDGTTSKFRGVNWDAILDLWVAMSNHGGKTKRIGKFESEEDAARAWDADAVRHGFSEEALNFPPPRPDGFEVL